MNENKSLTIAIVNNSSDSGLYATERQFCTLIAQASAGLVINLKFYSFPGIRRGDAARAHINRFYEKIEELEDDVPSGLIVTGAEPQSASLQEEAFWKPLARLVDWAEEKKIPSIWSCLAAHAAVLHADGIEREFLGHKLSGVFECHWAARGHDILRRMPRRWAVPHSRYYGLDRRSLESHGYTILSSSREAGVDMFMKQGATLRLFLQGHPEYEAGTLMAEYRRDLLRALQAKSTEMPNLPRMRGKWGSYLSSSGFRKTRVSRGAAVFDPESAKVAGHSRAKNDWSSGAQRLFNNWLWYLLTCQQTLPQLTLRNLAGTSNIANSNGPRTDLPSIGNVDAPWADNVQPHYAAAGFKPMGRNYA